MDRSLALRLIHDSTDMLARQAPDGTFRFVSPASRRLLGHGPDALVGRSPADLCHPDDRDRLAASHERVRSTTVVDTVEYRARHAEGHDVWLETTSLGIRDEDGHTIGIHSSTRDVTRRREELDRLAEAERRFRLAMDDAPIGIALVSLDGRFLRVNSRLAAIVDRTVDEMASLTWQAITHPDDLDDDLAHVDRLLGGDIDRYSMEKRYVRADGRPVWIQLSVSLLRDDDGRPQVFISHVADIEERKRAEAELRRVNEELTTSNGELERFAYVASHDLRSPLTTVQGYLGLLAMRYADVLGDDGREWIERARAQTVRLAETCDALLDLARGDDAAADFDCHDLAAVVSEVREALAPDLREAGAELTVGRLPSLPGDRPQLRLLFQNLLSNAVKFRHPERPLRVRIDARPVEDAAETTWRFVVEDNGIGVRSGDTEAIFEPFTRTDAVRDHDGVGIGLATCRRVVERHGGTIRAEPAEPGARFVFTLVAPPG